MQSLFDFSTPIPHMFIVTTGTLSKEYILYGQKPKDCKKYTLSFAEQKNAELYLIKRYRLKPPLIPHFQKKVNLPHFISMMKCTFFKAVFLFCSGSSFQSEPNAE